MSQYGNANIDAAIQEIDDKARGPAPPAITLSGEARRHIANAIKASMEAHTKAEMATKVRFEQARHREAREGLVRATRTIDTAPPAVFSVSPEAIADRAVVQIAGVFADKTSSLEWREGVIDLADGDHRKLLHATIAAAIITAKRGQA